MMKTKVFNQIIIISTFCAIILLITSCTKKNNDPDVVLKVNPTAGSPLTQFTIDVTDSRDDEDKDHELKMRMDWHDDGTWDSDWTDEKIHTNYYEFEGDHTIRVEVKDTEGHVSSTTETLMVTNSPHLIPIHSPFSYNVGINYETYTAGRNSRVIETDLDTITNHFKLIKTFHCAGVGTTDIVMDPNQKKLVDYLVNHIDDGLELAMGTNNSALASGGYGHPFTPGLMTQQSYTDQWVQMVIESFGGKTNVKKLVKVIMLGNEIDGAGPGYPHVLYSDYYSKWIPNSFENLKKSLKNAGLENIPVTTIIANYPQSIPADNDSVQTSVTRYITQNWSSDWNSGNPFLMFNMYTDTSGKSTNFGSVIKYFHNIDNIFQGAPDAYVGETGYSAEFGVDNQVKVVKQIFSWLEGQYQTNKLTIPLFNFMAFDRPDKKVGQKMMGLFKDDANNKPLGLKPNIEVPEWVKEKKAN